MTKIAKWIQPWIVAALLCFSSFLHAQSTLSGEARGEGGVALEDATAYLLRAADSSVLRLAVTEADGRFAFEGLGADTAFVVIRHAGHLPLYGPVLVLEGGTGTRALPPMQLEAGQERELATVAIVERLPIVEQRIDRTVVNVDALISVAGGSAMDALERSPGVSVDQNGLIKLKGRGVLVLIDDKPTYMSGTELENYLRGLPASSLKQIELMTNPPARYDAAGGGGIIVLRTKKNNIKGINGSLSLGYRQGRFAKTGNSFNLNYRRNRFNLFSALAYSENTGFQDLYIDRNYLELDGSPASYFRQRSYITWRSQIPSARVGMDYYLSDKTTLGLVVNGFVDKNARSTDNVSRVADAADVLTQAVYADNSVDRLLQNGGINLNFRHDFDSTGRSLTIDADHVVYDNTGKQVFLNSVLTPSGTQVYADLLNGNLPSRIGIYAAKADYQQMLPKGVLMALGAKAAYTGTDNAAFYDRTLDGVTAPDYTISNQFIYKEQIGAAYLNLSKDWKRLSLQAGLRAEATRSNGNQLGNPIQPASTFQRRYDNLFSTLYLNYKLDSLGNQQLNFSYGKRIDRPFFQDLNPFLSPLDKFTFYSGNPYLKPAFARAMTLTYSYGSNFSATLNYNLSRGEINETLEIVQGIYYSRPGNIGSSEILNLGMNGNLPIGKWYTLNAYVELGANHYVSKLYNQKLDAAGTYYFAQGTNQFQFGKGWSAELTGEMMSRYVQAQVSTIRVGFLTAGLKKNILKDKGSVKLSLGDMLYSRRFGGTINNLTQTYATYRSTIDSRILGFAFSYRFGKSLGEQRRHTGNSLESEDGRVKR
jgi:hypothetical protein